MYQLDETTVGGGLGAADVPELEQNRRERSRRPTQIQVHSSGFAYSRLMYSVRWALERSLLC